MGIKNRLTVMSFLQFCLGSLVDYNCKLLVWDDEVGRNAVWSCFGTMGIVSFMPTLTGIIADRWINAETIWSVTYFIWSSFILYPASCNT
jgi:NHS family xanthosine MFS transporter